MSKDARGRGREAGGAVWVECGSHPGRGGNQARTLVTITWVARLAQGQGQERLTNETDTGPASMTENGESKNNI